VKEYRQRDKACTKAARALPKNGKKYKTFIGTNIGRQMGQYKVLSFHDVYGGKYRFICRCKLCGHKQPIARTILKRYSHECTDCKARIALDTVIPKRNYVKSGKYVGKYARQRARRKSTPRGSYNLKKKSKSSGYRALYIFTVIYILFLLFKDIYLYTMVGFTMGFVGINALATFLAYYLLGRE